MASKGGITLPYLNHLLITDSYGVSGIEFVVAEKIKMIVKKIGKT